MFRRLFAVSILALISLPVIAGGGTHLDKAPIDLRDYASLQRGAKMYMQECYGCHSLKFMRYDSLAKGIEITNEEGEILDSVVKQNLMFVADKMSDPIVSAMPEADSERWFGVAPPDLSLVARSRGVDWLYTYLRTFYVDPNRPWGVNNLTFPDVGMPHVLLDLQGEQVLTKNGLKIVKKGTMSNAEYDSMIADLVNFLSYVGEPVQLKRKTIGAWVLVFLGIFSIFSYLLKREYWKDID